MIQKNGVLANEKKGKKERRKKKSKKKTEEKGVKAVVSLHSIAALVCVTTLVFRLTSLA